MRDFVVHKERLCMVLRSLKVTIEAVEVELEFFDGVDAAADPGDDGSVVPVALGVAPDGG